MSNPFETLNERLTRIENLLTTLSTQPKEVEISENVTVKEAAKMLKVSEQSVHNYIKRGLPPDIITLFWQ